MVGTSFVVKFICFREKVKVLYRLLWGCFGVRPIIDGNPNSCPPLARARPREVVAAAVVVVVPVLLPPPPAKLAVGPSAPIDRRRAPPLQYATNACVVVPCPPGPTVPVVRSPPPALPRLRLRLEPLRNATSRPNSPPVVWPAHRLRPRQKRRKKSVNTNKLSTYLPACLLPFTK